MGKNPNEAQQEFEASKKKQEQMEKEFKSKMFSSTYSAFRDRPQGFSNPPIIRKLSHRILYKLTLNSDGTIRKRDDLHSESKIIESWNSLGL